MSFKKCVKLPEVVESISAAYITSKYSQNCAKLKKMQWCIDSLNTLHTRDISRDNIVVITPKAIFRIILKSFITLYFQLVGYVHHWDVIACRKFRSPKGYLSKRTLSVVWSFIFSYLIFAIWIWFSKSSSLIAIYEV